MPVLFPFATSRPAIASLFLSLVLVALAPGATAIAACWLPPVDAAVADPFRRPACPWCPGNRGIEYATAPGEVVRAVATGVVTFSGVVAGTRYVVVEHADGLAATYGGLTTTHLADGDRVVARATVGITAGHLHFGVRAGEQYLDPADSLGTRVGRPRLLPLDGTPPRPAPPPRLRCPAMDQPGVAPSTFAWPDWSRGAPRSG